MNENLSDYLHGMPIYTFWWHFCMECSFMWSWTTRLDLCCFIFISMYDSIKFCNWMSLNSTVLQMLESCFFILSFILCFNVADVSIHILLIITSNKSLLLLISLIFAFWTMSSVTVLIALLNLAISVFCFNNQLNIHIYNLPLPSSSGKWCGIGILLLIWLTVMGISNYCFTVFEQLS